MKLKILLLVLFSFCMQDFCEAQILDRIKRKAEQRKRQKEDKAIDDGLDAIEGLFKKKKKEDEKDNDPKDEEGSENASPTDVDEKSNVDAENSSGKESSVRDNAKNVKPDSEAEIVKSWTEFDFVPGDKVIFYDDLQREDNGEFPSRWDIAKGTAENGRFGEERVIRMGNKSMIFPFMKNSKNYLPEKFTVEFDCHFSTYIALQEYRIQLYDSDIYYAKSVDGVRHYPIKMTHSRVKMDDFGAKMDEKRISKELGWRRVSISYNKGYLKMYVDEEKVLAIPRWKIKPTMLNIYAENYTKADKGMIKNIRIAEGGDRLYDRIMADGKFVTHGINFEYNSANIKPESMGVINKMIELMKEYSELNFDVVGHTDSDGSDTYNLTLSQKRAATVTRIMISQGISSGRLSAKGLGESSPLNDNKTAEDKANNRRVEFVKL